MTDLGWAPGARTRFAGPVVRRTALGVAGLLLLLVGAPAQSATLRIAVASNFAGAMTTLAERFEKKGQHRLLVSLGSTGKQYAQIVNGAPFDLFLAADVERPRRLEQAGLAIDGSRFTYAIGELVIWAPGQAGLNLPSVLADAKIGRIAIANPRLAPYGRAAQESLAALGLWTAVRPRLVRGENIAQAFQFVHSGSADVGLVAASQLSSPDTAARGSRWKVPTALYTPIEQQVVMLRDTPAGRAFLEFLRSESGRAMIRRAGYRVP